MSKNLIFNRQKRYEQEIIPQQPIHFSSLFELIYMTNGEALGGIKFSELISLSNEIGNSSKREACEERELVLVD